MLKLASNEIHNPRGFLQHWNDQWAHTGGKKYWNAPNCRKLYLKVPGMSQETCVWRCGRTAYFFSKRVNAEWDETDRKIKRGGEKKSIPTVGWKCVALLWRLLEEVKLCGVFLPLSELARVKLHDLRQLPVLSTKAVFYSANLLQSISFLADVNLLLDTVKSITGKTE